MARTVSVSAPRRRLTAKDHTAIVNLVMESPQHFARTLGARDLQREASRFGNARVLEALLAMPRLPASLRRKLQEALPTAIAIDQAGIRIPAAQRRILDRISAETRAASGARRKIAVLRRHLEDPAIAGEEGLVAGIRFAIEMLADGAATIYSARHPFYRQITEPSPQPQAAVPGPPAGGGGGAEGGGGGVEGGGTGAGGGTGGSGAGDHADDVGDSDVRGAMEGGMTGYLFALQAGDIAGEFGGAIGSTFGAIGSSTGSIGRKFVNWLFG